MDTQDNIQGTGETPAAATKWTPSDKSLTPKEAYELFREGKLHQMWAKAGIPETEFSSVFLEKSPVTPAALKTLEGQQLRYHPVLRKWLVTRAKAAGKQLDNEATQAVKKEFFTMEAKETDERKKLIDLRPDESSPNKDGETCIVCEEKFEPMSLFLTREGERVISKITGQPVRIGNYKIAPVNADGDLDPEKGKRSIVAVCKDCGRDVGGESYTYENAKEAIVKADAELEAEQNRANRAVLLRKTLQRPDGSHRFDSGDAHNDVDMAARILDARRAKGKFQGHGRHGHGRH